MNGTKIGGDFVDAQGRREPDRVQPTPTPLPDTTSPTSPPQSTNINTSATTTEEEYVSEYNMRHKNRGYALIFNNENFEGTHDKRDGTEMDEKDLKKTLSNLGFDVKPFKDLKWLEIEREIEKYAGEDHSDNDCILVAIMSHGELGYIWAKDRKYTLDRIWGPFVNCPTLVGKPKLFFIQACQGNKVEHGITLKSSSQTDGGGGPAIASGSVMSLDENDDVTSGSVTEYAIPNSRLDILIAYSTVPGYYSWRNPSLGSWFMQSLCAELNEKRKADEDDLLTLLTSVIRRVAVGYVSKSNDPEDKITQNPCITHYLTRLLYFRAKNPK